MNLADRLRIYRDRGLQEDEAIVLVLIEETGSAIFSAFPDDFVLFGGAALLLFYDSPRFSRDLDLLASSALPSFDEIETAVRKSIQPIAETLGLGQLDFQKYNESDDFIKCWVVANEKPLFSIDLTRIGGSIPESQIVNQTLAGATNRTLRTATANYLLLQKCEVFLARRQVKARDALARGASLNNNLKAHFQDFVLLKDLDGEFIEARIQSIDVRLCTAELRSVLPAALFDELASTQFEAIRDSLRKLFSQCVGEN
jgi:hypothetical protein